MNLRLCAFADEASSCVDEQIKILHEEGICLIELRGLDGKNVSELTQEEARAYKRKFNDEGIQVWSIGSPLGKIKAEDDFEAHLRKTEHTVRIANIFGATRIRAFSFFTDEPEKERERVLDRVGQMTRVAQEGGVLLCHENEKEIYGDTARRCLDLLENTDGLACVFDPANFVQCGQDVNEALALLQSKTDYYHIKDARKGTGAVVPAGKGDGCLREMIKGICNDTVLTLEPHLTLFDGYAALDSTELKNEYVYPTARHAFAAAVGAIKELLKEEQYTEENGIWKK